MEIDLFKADTETFLREIEGPNAQKVAEAAGLYIAQKLRERSFTRGGILTPRSVTRFDLQADENHDQLYFLDEKEINVSPATNVNFRGEPDTVYIEGSRYRIPIQEVASPIFEKREVELLAYTQPVTKVLEENVVREIEEVEDTNFLAAADAAAASQLNDIDVSTGTNGALTKGAIKAGMNRIDRNRLLCRTVLMSKLTFNDLYTLTFAELGSDLLKEITVEGYKYYQLGGLKLVVSIKDSMFLHPSKTCKAGTEPAHLVYFFAEEKALGRFLSFERTKFGVRKIFQLIQMAGWEYIGIGIGNTAGCARVTLID